MFRGDYPWRQIGLVESTLERPQQPVEQGRLTSVGLSFPPQSQLQQRHDGIDEDISR